MKQDHTPEPWLEGNPSDAIVAENPVHYMGDNDEHRDHYGGYVIAESMTVANRRRALACVNACQGISTKDLEESCRPAPTLKDVLLELYKFQEQDDKKDDIQVK